MDIQTLKAELAQLRMPLNSTVVLQTDAEGNSYTLLDIIVTYARYVATCSWAGRVYQYGCDQPSVPCVVLHGNRNGASKADRPPVTLGELIKHLAPITGPAKVILMPDYERPLQGVSRDVFKLGKNTLDVYNDDEDSEDDEDENDSEDDDNRCTVEECVVLFPVN